MKHHKAPWGTPLILISSLSTVLCAGMSVGFMVSGHAGLSWLGLLPLVILAGGALFTIRGYTVTDGAILVHRLLWATRLSLAGLRSARLEPDAMRGSIRTFGNGGLFSFAGNFRNKQLGAYRAFVTDLRRTVVLRFASRTVVVSPGAPDDFIREIMVAGHEG